MIVYKPSEPIRSMWWSCPRSLPLIMFVTWLSLGSRLSIQSTVSWVGHRMYTVAMELMLFFSVLRRYTWRVETALVGSWVRRIFPARSQSLFSQRFLIVGRATGDQRQDPAENSKRRWWIHSVVSTEYSIQSAQSDPEFLPHFSTSDRLPSKVFYIDCIFINDT